MEKMINGLKKAGYNSELIDVLLEERNAELDYRIKALKLKIKRIGAEQWDFVPLDSERAGQMQKPNGCFLIDIEVSKYKEIYELMKSLGMYQSLQNTSGTTR